MLGRVEAAGIGFASGRIVFCGWRTWVTHAGILSRSSCSQVHMWQHPDTRPWARCNPAVVVAISTSGRIPASLVPCLRRSGISRAGRLKYARSKVQQRRHPLPVGGWRVAIPWRSIDRERRGLPGQRTGHGFHGRSGNWRSNSGRP